ncbi:hypothetical protein [Salinimicrobium marinum]|uniref:hypothetical protein n=1 Tax=Salinimicrobium marinum TaxID=680283 RepID=UPI00167C13B9|nr:hypothetical protein [Salinimicrobium marinum]
MQSFKKHIAIALLAGFLCPQVMSSIHFLVISHSYSSESNTAFRKADSSYLYHTCHYHLNSFSSVLPIESRLEKVDFISAQNNPNFSSLENYVHQEDFNFQLRGPPV